MKSKGLIPRLDLMINIITSSKQDGEAVNLKQWEMNKWRQESVRKGQVQRMTLYLNRIDDHRSMERSTENTNIGTF